jgi:hypothetical protein
MLAHRAAYEAHAGSIPEGMLILHRCDVTACVNPAHLFLGTNTDNMRDMAQKGRCPDRRGARAPLAKLTWDAVNEIRSTSATISGLARKFGVSRRAVRFARKGVTWVE